jgi:cation-transporting ATPase E
MTTTALAIGVAGAALIEASWWIRGSVPGEKRRLWRSDQQPV